MRKEKEFRLHPALVFFILTIIIMIISSVGNLLNLEASYYTVNSVTGDLESQIVTISNLFNRTGLRYLISNMITNFTTFAPLGNLLVGLFGIGVAYKSGFLNTLFCMIAKKVSKKTLTFITVMLGVILSMFTDAAYVILLPLAALLFINLERHPSAGICAAFSGIAFGSGANVIINGLDSTLKLYTSNASTILDTSYTVNMWGNIFVMIIATILISYIGMIVTEKYVVPRLGRYNFDEEELEESKNITPKEKKGVILSLITVGIITLILIYCLIPGLPLSGLLLNPDNKIYIDKLFGSDSYFYQGSVFIFSALLALAGLMYGLRVKTVKNNRDLIEGMSHYLKNISSILVLIFFAAQFCLIFKETNIGVFIVASLSELLNNIELSGILLVIITFIITLISSFFVPSTATKWAILAPVVVPMFMQNSLTPEFAQVVFRSADSAVKGITPLFTYFVILIGFLQIYNKKKNNVITITDAMSLLAPYTIAFSVLWLLIVLGFYIIGIPIGINTNVML